jgi:hypothetical protein
MSVVFLLETVKLTSGFWGWNECFVYPIAIQIFNQSFRSKWSGKRFGDSRTQPDAAEKGSATTADTATQMPFGRKVERGEGCHIDSDHFEFESQTARPTTRGLSISVSFTVSTS